MNAVVSGASRGIGLEVARVFAQDGFRVVMLARSEPELRTRAEELGAHAIPLACDVTDADAVARAVERIATEFGGAPDVIVNNAGMFKLTPVEQTDVRDFQSALDVNLVAPFVLVRAFLARMRARKSGHIVTIGSIADRVTFPENAAYAASKFGLRAFHEVLRGELRGSGVRASLVSPGPVDTALWDEIDPDAKPGFTARADMLRAADVAQAVRYVVTAAPSVNVDELRLSHS